MGIEILPKERNKSCLFLRSPSPPKSSHRSPLGLELCLCCKGEKREWHIPVSLTECLDSERNEMKGKITSYNQFQKSFSFFIEA